MKKFLIIIGLSGFFFSTVSCANKGNAASEAKTETAATEGASVEYLNEASFKEKVFDYENNKAWKYAGTVPAIVDFYADWCGPCKMLSPILVEMQKEYGEKIQIYKINTDKEKVLASTFGIQSLPTIIFIPVGGEPQAVMGYRAKADLEKLVSEVLKVQK